MMKLIRGLHHFQSSVFLSHKTLFERLAQGQTPDALFITCSDSRISPSLLTQTKPGDLFILRNAGNIIPPHPACGCEVCGGEAATIEFAVVALGVRDIIVCGHSHCGAVKGLMNPASLSALPATSAWLKHAEAVRRNVLENYPGLDEAQALNVAIQENVLAQLENLRSHPCVAERLAAGTLNLHGWLYHFETGRVFVYQPDEGQFLPLSDAGLEVLPGLVFNQDSSI